MCPYFGTKSVRGTISSSIAAPFVVKVQKKIKKLCRVKRTIFFTTLALLTVVCQGIPIIAPNRGNMSNTAVSQMVVFLTKYGYLPPSDFASSLRSESQLREAISTMQIYGGLKPTGFIDEATLELMQRKRCGVSDVIPGGPYRVKRYAIQGQKWPSTNLSWSVKSRDTASDIRMVRSQLRKAFQVWSAASALTFEEVQGQSADILVSFLKGQHGDGYPFDGEGAVLAHAFFPGEGIGGDAHFDADERWLSSQPEDEDEGVNLFAVAAHEIGHSLGLSHSSTPGSLMFPYYQVMGEYFTLPKDDADGIRHLYGYKNPDSQPTMPPITLTTTLQTTSTKRGKYFTTKQATQKPRKTTKVPPTIQPQVPDMCNTSVDAISVIRREAFIFKGRHFWRMDVNRTVKAGYPVPIERFWHTLPPDIEKIDAVYERPIDTKIVFFTGKMFWLFFANQLESGYPRPLTDLGLPDDLEHIDAAMVWGHNGKTYFFSGKEYWKFDENEGRVELDYPRSINSWRGVPANIDAAFQWTDGNTYFFKETKFWKFIDIKMRIQSKGPSDIGGFWFKCPSKSMEIPQPTTTNTPATEPNMPNTSATLKTSQFCCLILLTFLMYFKKQTI